MAEMFEERKTKGHGVCGCIFTFILVIIVIGGILLFSTNLFKGYKNKILSAFYPQKYSEYVSKYAAEYKVDEDLVYAVIRCESGFRPEVESSAGAVGLMQLMPETFYWLQNDKDGEVLYSSELLTDPGINIEYGIYYLSWLCEKYEEEETAVAAYNAGISNVDDWLSDKAYSLDGRTLSLIPFQETKEYVEKVEKTKETYQNIYHSN